MKIAIGCDHVGYEMKSKVIAHLEEKGYIIENFGTDSSDRTDYPIYGNAVGKAVASGDCEKGILICGTGVGISISANKIKGVRAVVCSEPYTALLSREHNDTNILAFGARVVGSDLALMIIDAWLSGKYQGERHAKRVKMISNIENGVEI